MKIRFNRIFSIVFLALIFSACQQEYQFGLPEDSNEFPSSVLYNNKVDIIFIVDDSDTMKHTRANLVKSVPTLVNSLFGLKLDMHIAVISTSSKGDNGGGYFYGAPSYLTNSSYNLSGELSSRLLMGNLGHPREAGLENLLKVLSPSYLNGPARGFLRDEALLAVIAITNEDDHSGLGDKYVYADYLDSLKGYFDNGDRKWQVNLIGILDPSDKQCATNPEFNYVERSTKYIELVEFSKGKMESICSTDLGPAVGNIRARIVQVLTDFPLGRLPDVNSIRVYSNGNLVPRSSSNGWDYISEGNLVRFFGSWVPAADVQIRVDFTPATPK